MADDIVPVAPLVCVECGREDNGEPGWKMEEVDLDELAAYCPECWERELGRRE